MNSKHFDEPELEIIRFDNTDVIATSGGYDPDNAGYEDGGDTGIGDGDVLE